MRYYRPRYRGIRFANEQDYIGVLDKNIARIASAIKLYTEAIRSYKMASASLSDYSYTDAAKYTEKASRNLFAANEKIREMGAFVTLTREIKNLDK